MEAKIKVLECPNPNYKNAVFMVCRTHREGGSIAIRAGRDTVGEEGRLSYFHRNFLI